MRLYYFINSPLVKKINVWKQGKRKKEKIQRFFGNLAKKKKDYLLPIWIRIFCF